LKIFGFEWFFKGMEEYRFMATRNMISKIIGVFLIFWLIKGPEDYMLYGLISIITDFFSKFLNFINLKKMVGKVSRDELDIRAHISGSVSFFLIFISAKIYADIDKVMLGFISTNASVSYYVTANKLINIIKAMFIAASSVLIPRFSYLIAQGQSHKFKPLAQKAFSIIFFLPIPAMAGLYLLADEVVLMFGGPKYLPAVLTMKILLPILFLLPLKSFVGKQILITFGQHKIVLMSVTMATVLNIILNSFLISRYSQNGAAVATLVSEVIIITLEILVGYKYFKDLELNVPRNFIYIVATFFMTACVFFSKRYLTAGFAPMSQILASSLIGAVSYFLFLLLFRENLFLPMIFKMITGKKGGKKDD
jgi:O-antigen/teichoic acid export membrane protein